NAIVHFKDFTSSYYFFFVLCGVISLINEFNINIGTRLPLCPDVNSFYGTVDWIKQGPFPSLLFAFGHFFGAVHEFINVFIAINRATSIIAPRSHEKIWKYGIPISCAILVILGVVGSWHLFDTPTKFIGIPHEGKVYFIMLPDSRKHPEISNSRNAAITSIVSPVISVSLYTISICFLRKKWKLKIVRTEFSLLLLGLTSMLLGLPLAFQQLYFFMNKAISDEEVMILFQMLPWLFDLRFFSPTLLVLATDSNMRDKFLGMFGGKTEVSILIPSNHTVTSLQMWSWLLILYTIYVPIFIALWIVEICLVIFHRKDFTSSYYFFFVLCGVISLINEFNINVGTRLPLCPEVNSVYGTVDWIQHGPFPSLLYAFGHFFGAVHVFINVFIAINRATAIIAPHSHEKIWRYGIPIACVLLVGLGVVGSWHLFDTPTKFIDIPHDGKVFFVMLPDSRKHPEITNSRNSAITSVVSPVISISLYTTSIYFLRRKWKLKILRTEFSLLLLGLSSMLLSLPLTFQQLYWFMNPDIGDEEVMRLFQMLPWLFDLRFFAPTLLVLATDSIMREKFLGMF
ncbi:hypothetical protein PFISCL1PPCAC_28102, partial [Pristionchus fissidentatus]